MARTFAIAGAIAIALGGAAIGYAVTRKGGMSDAQSAAMASAVTRLDGDIKAMGDVVHARAVTLAEPAAIRSAIGTDVRTVDDLVTRGDFVPQKGERLEFGQIDRTSKKIDVLLPKGVERAGHDGIVGRYVEIAGDQLEVTEILAVVPKYNPERYAGFLGVTRPLDLGPAVQQLVAAQITGKLAVGDRAIAIGALPAGAATLEQPLVALPGAKLIVAAPAAQGGMSRPIVAGGAGLVVLGLLLLVVGVMRKHAPPTTAAFQAMTTQPSTPPQTSGIGSAQTQLSQHPLAAAGTPSPIDPTIGPQIVPSNLGPGSMIGRWQVVRRLGSGGMADVFLAQAKGDGGFEKLVAIKVMHSHLARNQRAVDLFLDEARLAARIHHPNVVAIQDLGKIGNDYVIVMEYVEGVDLERLLLSARTAQRPVPIAVALGILSRICDGLDAAHRATAPDGSPLGIIHRDVKSANVLVSRQGSVKVVDFGIAKAAKQVHYTVAGETKGTPAMMAPEQRVGEQVDVRADVYSAAAVGYELVTGQGVNLDLASLAHLGVENWPHLPLPSSLRAGLPVELDEILLHAMAFERERRPADCAALGSLCEAVMKRYNLSASDKDIARWADSELRQLSPAFVGATTNFSKSPSA